MSFIVEKAGPQRVRICFDPKERFPDKVFAVATDGYLVKWVKNGTAVEVEEDHFERIVLKCYPGFVQIPSFVNFRRLFREYSFHWSLVDEENLVYEFSHPLFLRDKPELLANIRTKRKSFAAPVSAKDSGHMDFNDVEPINTKYSQSIRTTRRQKVERRPTLATVPCVGTMPMENSVIYSQNQDSNISSSSNIEERLHRKKEALGDMMNFFARNEMNVSEYEQYLQNQRKLQEQQYQEIPPIEGNGEAMIIENNDIPRNIMCRPDYSYHPVETKYIPVNFDHGVCETGSRVYTKGDVVSAEGYSKEEDQETPKSPENYSCFCCDPNAVNASTSYVQYPAEGNFAVPPTMNEANPCDHCSFSCSCCKHCNGCHHHSQDYTINQLGGGDTSVSYFNL